MDIIVNTRRPIAVTRYRPRVAVGTARRGQQSKHPRQIYRRRRTVVAVVGCCAVGAFALVSKSSARPSASQAAPSTLAQTGLTAQVVTSATAAELTADLDATSPGLAGCVLTAAKLVADSTGPDVGCAQRALADAGFYQGDATATFDEATARAVRAMQQQRSLFVDGVIGRESAISLGIWPNEQNLVVRTPPPPAGAVDLAGFKLSSVASVGADAPSLPPDSGTGRRLVYSRSGQRIWAVDVEGRLVRSWLVSGSKYANEKPGTHQVYSRSEQSTAWNGKANLPLMVRWLKTDRGALGFHGIPTHVDSGEPYQTEAELGTRLSGGCQRQATRDAQFVWDFATIGTPVVVL